MIIKGGEIWILDLYLIGKCHQDEEETDELFKHSEKYYKVLVLSGIYSIQSDLNLSSVPY